MIRPVLLPIVTHERELSRHFAAVLIHRFVFVMMWIGICLLKEFSVFAAEPSDDTDYPILVVNAASLQRLRDDADVIFNSAERLDRTDQLDQWMANTLKETKGLDRSRPFGLMLYLSPELIGAPVPIAYLPVSNLDESLATIASEAGQIVPVEGNQNRHVIHYTESLKLKTLYRDGYLFLVGPDANDSALERNFPNPEKLTSRLSTEYDVAVSLMLKKIPPALKTAFLAAFATQARANLQQRDEEPESAYRLRRANGELWIEILDRVVKQGEEFTLGARIDHDKEIANIDLEIAGARDSKLSKFFLGMAGKRTYFGNLLANPSTFTASVSLLLDEKQRKLFVTYFDAALKDLPQATEVEDTEGLVKIVDPIFKTLVTSAEVGHLDAFAQLTGDAQGEFTLIAGVKLANSRGLPAQIADTLQHLKESPNASDALSKLELGFDSVDSYPIHRLPIEVPEKGGQRMFGETAHLYVYASHQAVWCAFGGDAALDSLKSAVQTVALPQDVQQNRNRVPFQFITHAKNWLSVTDEENPGAVVFNEQAQASFESDNDAMKLEIRPTDSGVRLRIEFEGGFLGLMGRGISKGIDTGFFKRERQDGKDKAKTEPEKPRDSR